jgi:hypothetical protein
VVDDFVSQEQQIFLIILKTETVQELGRDFPYVFSTESGLIYIFRELKIFGYFLSSEIALSQKEGGRRSALVFF